MTDRELLERAAKAAGIPLKEDFADRFFYYMADPLMWNPLTNDGDALRLAVRCRILAGIGECQCCAEAHYEGATDGEPIRVRFSEHFADREAPDAYAATRLAIVRAAAAMADGKTPNAKLSGGVAVRLNGS